MGEKFGFQQRFSPEYLTAMDLVKSGRIGEIKMMMSYWILGGTPPKTAPESLPPQDEKIRRWGSWMERSPAGRSAHGRPAKISGKRN